MIRITIALDMPAGHTDLAEYSSLLDEHDMPPAAFELAGATTPDRLIATREISTDPLPAGTPVQSVPAPAPAPTRVARTPPKARRPKGTATPDHMSGGSRPGRGTVDVAGKVISVVESRAGRFVGSSSELAALAHPDNMASARATVNLMLRKGQLVAERSGRNVTALALPGHQAAAPDPAELATEPIRRVPFDPDKARAGAVLGL